MNDMIHKSLLEISAAVFAAEPLSKYTTLGVGGPADWVVYANRVEQIVDVIDFCRHAGLPCKLLGGGSNIVVSDSGYSGVIIINRADKWSVLDAGISSETIGVIAPRLHSGEGLLAADSIENTSVPVLVRIASGARLTPLAKHLYQEGIFGLQWFAAIPATVGGAIYMNMHGGSYYFGSLVDSALLYNGAECRRVGHDYFKFDYDYSVLHKTNEIILEADLHLRRGDTLPIQQMARDWARQKAIQPQKSAGCIFQNISVQEQQKCGLPSASIGYLIDKVLGLKGLRKGDAIISERHAAFIENLGEASAQDVYYLYNRIRDAAREKVHVDLKPEVEFIGPF